MLEPVLSSSRCIFSARAAASAISSGLTSSPLRIRAAISGVTRTFLTFVWKPGAVKVKRVMVESKQNSRFAPPFPIPCTFRRQARYHLRAK